MFRLASKMESILHLLLIFLAFKLDDSSSLVTSATTTSLTGTGQSSSNNLSQTLAMNMAKSTISGGDYSLIDIPITIDLSNHSNDSFENLSENVPESHKPTVFNMTNMNIKISGGNYSVIHIPITITRSNTALHFSRQTTNSQLADNGTTCSNIFNRFNNTNASICQLLSKVAQKDHHIVEIETFVHNSAQQFRFLANFGPKRFPLKAKMSTLNSSIDYRLYLTGKCKGILVNPAAYCLVYGLPGNGHITEFHKPHLYLDKNFIIYRGKCQNEICGHSYVKIDDLKVQRLCKIPNESFRNGTYCEEPRCPAFQNETADECDTELRQNCFCNRGFVRNTYTGSCIKRDECPKWTTS